MAATRKQCDHKICKRWAFGTPGNIHLKNPYTGRKPWSRRDRFNYITSWTKTKATNCTSCHRFIWHDINCDNLLWKTPIGAPLPSTGAPLPSTGAPLPSTGASLEIPPQCYICLEPAQRPIRCGNVMGCLKHLLEWSQFDERCPICNNNCVMPSCLTYFD